ncbi:uncharacterized protein N7506_005228 [Penicillium brevicompactum]|uniref:uncharacterized protein n=1 Tax=Penicillium brevicompactum TaxID=5074 RepID=UPI002540E6F5|nr:uncharacterized protein N7506_005228 [Penicillium brevicompactum]KAJ5337206.1 hypothetical protein N7506_005228 [Penicillium brevicompactum]
METSPHSNDEYTIGWISALSDELKVAMAMLDEEHGMPQSLPREDSNVYNLGKIGGHKIAMACLPGGQTGTGPAAVVAENMRRTFKNIRFAFLVGIGGGVPGKGKDIRLGDVVVSHPRGIYTGVVQYDYGKLNGNGDIQRKDWFSAPPMKVLSAVTKLETLHTRPKNPKNNMAGIVDELGEDYAYPEASEALDHLYRADHAHIPEAETCDSCDTHAIVSRKPRKSPSKPRVHYGIIASGNMVLKNGVEREKIDQRYENLIMCFEMEAAGMMNNFPCLVIRGISDYSDSHKNDEWRNRAIAVASAYAKELLCLIEPSDMDVLPPIAARALETVSKKLKSIDENTSANTELLEQSNKESRQKREQDLQMQFEAWLKPPNVREIQQDEARRRLPGTCDWIWTNPTFLCWNDSSLLSAPDRVFCIYGPPGSGKSILASAIVDRLWNEKVATLFYTFSGMNASHQQSNGLIRSLLWQLVKIVIQKQSTSLLSTLMLMGQPTISDLWTGINEIATLVSEPIYCIVDGVDESMDPISELLERVLALLEARSNFRFILLGRQHSFHQADSIRHKIEVHPALTKDDVDRVIEMGINRSAILNKQDVREKVLRSLQEQSDGNFLWVRLMFVHLEKSLPLAHGIKRLNKLPRDLESIYEEFFLRLSRTLEPDELILSQRLFAFIVVSQRPLSIAEVQHLLAADASSTSKADTQSLQDCLIPGLDQRILDLCGDLINIVNGCLQLVHFSVKEFLVRPKKQWPNYGKRRKTMKFRVAPEGSHSSLASACMLYLDECLDDSPVHDQDNTSELERCHPFLRYSFTYLHTHLHQSGLPTDSTLNDLRNFLKSNRWIAWWEILLIGNIEDDSLLSHSDEGEKFLSWLGDKHEEMLVVASASLKITFEKRAQEFGVDDPRTERIGFSLHYLGGLSVSPPAEAPGSCAAPNSSLSMNPRQIMRLVRGDEPLSSQLKANLVLGMLAYLQKAKHLTDPMQLLFDKILQYGSSMPVYVLLNVGYFCSRVGRLEQAVEFYLVGLRTVEQREDRIKYQILFELGYTYWQLGQYKKSLQPLKDCLAGWAQILGPEHEDTLMACGFIGRAHYRLGEHAESLEFFERALIGQEKVLGPGHKNTLFTLHHIGVAYFYLSKYAESLVFLKRALNGLERVLEPEHEETMNILSFIGEIYFRQHHYTESLDIYNKLLAGREKFFGPEHDTTLQALNRIGALYSHQGQYIESLKVFKRVLAVQEKLLGPDHDTTLQALEQIGGLYSCQNQYTESLEVHKKVLASREKVLGSDHDKTFQTLGQIGRLYCHQHRYTESLEVFRKVLIGREKISGLEDETTLRTFEWVGYVYSHQRQYTEALKFYRKALAGREKAMLPKNEEFLRTLQSVGNSHIGLHQFADSLEFLKRALRGQEQILGPEHKDTLLTYQLIWNAHKSLGYDTSALLGFTVIDPALRSPERVYLGAT